MLTNYMWQGRNFPRLSRLLQSEVILSWFLAKTDKVIQATIHGSEWWKRRKQTNSDKGWRNSILSRRISALNNNTIVRIGTILRFLPNPHQFNFPNKTYREKISKN